MRVVVVWGWCVLALPLVGTRERTATSCLSLLRLSVVVGIVEMLLQCIGGKFLAHPRTVQYTTAVMVDESGSVDASRVRVAENNVHALRLQAALEVFRIG